MNSPPPPSNTSAICFDIFVYLTWKHNQNITSDPQVRRRKRYPCQKRVQPSSRGEVNRILHRQLCTVGVSHKHGWRVSCIFSSFSFASHVSRLYVHKYIITCEYFEACDCRHRSINSIGKMLLNDTIAVLSPTYHRPR